MTKQFEKKLQFFKDYIKNKYNKEIIESESGNYYVYLDNNEVVTKVYNSYRLILMLTKNSKFKSFNTKIWGPISRFKHKELYYYNKKCSWLLTEPTFNRYKICIQFESLSEFKEYCGYKFIDDDLFRDKFSRFSNKILSNKDKTLIERIKLMFITTYMSSVTE